LIIIVGVGIFGTFTGYLANLFLSPGKKADAAEAAPVAVDRAAAVSQLRELVAKQQSALDELKLLLGPEHT
jgi:voltage-gated potassium channel